MTLAVGMGLTVRVPLTVRMPLAVGVRRADRMRLGAAYGVRLAFGVAVAVGVSLAPAVRLAVRGRVCLAAGRGVPAADRVGKRCHQRDAQAEADAHRPFTARSNVRCDFSYLHQRVGQELAPDVTGGNLEDEIFSQLSQAAVEQFILFAG